MFVINFSLVSIKSFASTNPFQKNSVLKRGRGGIPPPNPLLPPRPSEAVRNSAQNVFALGSEYPTNRNFASFLSQTEALPRGFAPRLGGFAPCAKPHNPTARKTKRKRIVYLKS
ncbi:MAG TPA: hypothetical protein DCZ83_03200 [Candidatus Yonathbacteria bacterium]|nr:hypothetical protein [Candidatus Yonathbacteria bacterium]